MCCLDFFTSKCYTVILLFYEVAEYVPKNDILDPRVVFLCANVISHTSRMHASRKLPIRFEKIRLYDIMAKKRITKFDVFDLLYYTRLEERTFMREDFYASRFYYIVDKVGSVIDITINNFKRHKFQSIEERVRHWISCKTYGFLGSIIGN